MYYPDLSVYSYSQHDHKYKTLYNLPDDTQYLNVGWLDKAFEYPKGTVDDGFWKNSLSV